MAKVGEDWNVFSVGWKFEKKTRRMFDIHCLLFQKHLRSWLQTTLATAKITYSSKDFSLIETRTSTNSHTKETPKQSSEKSKKEKKILKRNPFFVAIGDSQARQSSFLLILHEKYAWRISRDRKVLLCRRFNASYE
jgi:hypothetical protein